MGTAKQKSTNNQSRFLNRNPLSFSMRQKKKERSEVRNNASYNASSPALPAHEECPSPIQCEYTVSNESLSPVMEETATHQSLATQKPAAIPATPKQPPKRLDSAAIFPYSNKPHETRKKTIAEESKQWESLFDPQHTFGSFQTSIAKPVSSQHYFYKGKWPLDQEDILGMIPKPKKTLHQQNSATTTPNLSIVDGDGASTAAFAFPTVPSPTLPNKKQLELHINPVLQDNENDIFDDSFPKSGSQIEILPCPSLTQFPKYKKTENEVLWKDRLELLKKIQHQGFREDLNGTLSIGNQESAAVRLQRQIKRKAEKIMRETLVYSNTEEDEDNDENEHNCNIANAAEKGTLLVAVEPDTMLVDFSTLHTKEEQDTVSSLHSIQPYESSLVSLDDEWENISFKPPCSVKDVDIENQASKQDLADIKRKNRPTFLLFAYGFLFPPLWIIGALYSPSRSLQRTASSKKIDQKWKNYSRNAFFVFIVIVATIIVLILVLKPQTVGFRSSGDQIYPEERIVFDENNAHIPL
ncbi:Translationally-controlled tumor protein [Mucor velutinosus]|uniref:Translationally-controlled tumor protein n=1 Tax=Mucor velutinosus TaxID=708070 RepID=A0AAN7HY92_9FUNG|nr:Translationally-controlled tumor protein [Mucor velutinosus]